MDKLQSVIPNNTMYVWHEILNTTNSGGTEDYLHIC